MITGAQQVRNSVIYLLPVVVGNLLPLATLPVFTRALSREEYGAWALATAYAVFVTGLGNFGLTLGYERNFFEHKDEDGRARLLYSTLLFVLTVFAAATVVTWMFRTQIASFVIGSPAFSTLLVVTMCANAVMSLKVYYLIFFRNTGEARAHVWYSVDESVGAAVLGVIFVVAFKTGVWGIPLAQLISSAVVFIALSARFARRLPVAFSGRLLRESLKVSYPLTPRILLGVAGSQADKYLIGLLGTLGGVGIYTVGQRLAYIVFSYMTALENVFAPQVFDKMFSLGKEGGESVGTYLTPFAYASTLAALGIGLFSEELLVVLTPSSYHGAIPVAAILSLHYGIMFFGKLPQLLYAKKTGVISVVTLVTLAANLALNVVFIRTWGAVGAAAGTLAAGLISVALVVVLGQRYYPIQWQLRAIASIFGVLFVAIIGSVWLYQADVAYLPRLGWKVASFAAYVAVGVALGIVTRSNLGFARHALRRRLVTPHA